MSWRANLQCEFRIQVASSHLGPALTFTVYPVTARPHETVQVRTKESIE